MLVVDGRQAGNYPYQVGGGPAPKTARPSLRCRRVLTDWVFRCHKRCPRGPRQHFVGDDRLVYAFVQAVRLGREQLVLGDF